MNQYQWIVSQIGSREHYAVPRIFHRTGKLDLFLTDFWCGAGRSLWRHGPQKLRTMAARYHPDIPANKVKAFNLSSIFGELKHRRHDASQEALFSEFERIGKTFAERVNDAIVKRNPGSQHAFFGYQSGSLETLQLMKSRGIFSVVDQTDPGKVEEDLVLEEMQRWPGWSTATGRIPQSYWDRLQAEWATADRVVVNSQWSRSALIQQGVAAEKILVIPLAYESAHTPITQLPGRSKDRPLTVLWLGSVILRKGIQYLIEAAKRLEGCNIRFLIAGPIGITDLAIRQAPASMNFLGRVTRDRASSMYQQADVFVLPTISDGFAITQLEAMAHGLPVITTRNCGDVVEDGKSGLLVPAGNAVALAEAIKRLEEDRSLLESMSPEAIARCNSFTLESYGRQLDAAHGMVPDATRVK